MRILLPALALVACSGDSPAPPPPPPLAVDLLVASRGTGTVIRYDGSGTSKGVFASDPMLVSTVGITFGPDGDLYAAAGDTPRILRFDGKTGASKGLFTKGGTIESPRNLNFGPDGNFYVADGVENQILRFTPAGDFVDVFVADPILSGPTSFTFGPDGDLYVVSVLTNKVLKFDGQTGAVVGPFAQGNLIEPHDVAFGPDGNLYVTSAGSTKIGRFRGDTGAFIDTFVDDSMLVTPLGVTWGPDGNLYIANQGRNDVRRYDGKSGAPIDTFVPAMAGGLVMPTFVVFAPTPSMTLTALADGTLVVQGAQPGARILLVRGAAGGSGGVPDCPGLALTVGAPVVDQTRTADESGMTVATPLGTGSFVAVDAARCVAAAL